MPTLDERIEAARKLTGYMPGPWECFHGLQTGNWHSAVYGPAGDYDALLIAVCNQNDSHRADTVLIAAAPDLHSLVLDLAAERERLREHLEWYADQFCELAFICCYGDSKDRILVDNSYGRYIAQTVYVRNQIALDEPKCVTGGSYADVISNKA